LRNSFNGSGRTTRRPSRPGVQSFGPSRRTNKPARRGAYINPAKFINKAIAAHDEIAYEATHTFADFPFSPELMHNIAKKGYVNPSPIQDQAIMPILEGRDVIGLANTGTGKTAAFGLPIIEKLSGLTTAPSVLIMAPTRELAQQIDEQFREFSQGMRLYSTLVVGGMNMERQIRDLKRRPHIIIGTPGRLKDLLERGSLHLKNISFLVLDEADRMLDMGFINDIKAIVNATPRERQTLFFSATINPTIERIVQDFLTDPITISVRTSETSDHVEQDVVEVAGGKEEKLDRLVDLLKGDAMSKVLIFGETKYGVQRLADTLSKAGMPAEAIHGNKSQPQRQRALKAFKDERVKILVATDVAARGLDIPNVSHVINFDQPASYEDYVHRIGRTGRGGERGTALTFIAPRH
jgi:ATP-dependent RNA helicase RhlE